jgi:hypothetical protein
MKKQIITYLILITLFNVNLGYSQFIGSGSTAPGNLTTLNNIGIGTTGATNAKLELLSTSNQLRLSRTGTIFSDINTTVTGLNLNSNTGNISFGNPTITKIIHFNSNITGSGDVPAGASITSPMTASNEGLSLYSSGSASSLAKLGAYAYSSAGWKSMWETANVNSVGQLPNLLLVRNGGNVGIGTGATTPSQKLDVNGNFSLRGNNFIYNTTDGIINWGSGTTGNLYFRTLTTQGVTTSYTDRMTILNNGNVGIGSPAPTTKLEVAGQVKITGGTPGTGKVLTSDATGLASWQPVSGLLSGGTANYLPKWSSANSLSSTSLIYDNGGGIGIGTNSPTQLLQLGDRFVFHNGGNKYLGYNVSFNGSSNVRLANDFSSAISFGGGDIDFSTAASGAANSVVNATSKFVIKNDGQIGIGTSTPNKTLTIMGDASITTSAVNALDIIDASTSIVNFRVKTDGKLYAREVNVQLTNFPDYVFAKEYKLTPLNEVESYININKHLKGFETAKKYESEGVNIGEIVKLQQEKIEELTLYIIELKKEVDAVKKQGNKNK